MSRRINLLSDRDMVPAVTVECATAENDAVVATVLRWAQRAGADKAAIEEPWAMLGLDADGEFARAKELGRSRDSRIRSDAVALLDLALQECLSDFCHPSEFGGYDTDCREAATIAVDALLAHADLLAELAARR